MPIGPGPRIGETFRLGTSPTRGGPPEVECSGCFKMVY